MTHDPSRRFVAVKGNNWDDCATEYSKLSEEIGFYRQITDGLVRLIDPTVHTLVDFGCGDGRLTQAVLTRGRELGLRPRKVILVDKFPQMLTLTEEINDVDVEFLRLCDTELLSQIPIELASQIDTIACNSSLFFGGDIERFLGRAHNLLKTGGSLVANIPDQDFHFEDGWQSVFREQANRLWDDPGQGQPNRFSYELLRRVAGEAGFELETEELTFQVPWEDFVRFYSIPFMGARRMPSMTQEERLAFLQELTPRFTEIPYRWVFFVMQKQG